MVATDDARSIGQRARTIRRRRGFSVEVAAGFAGISKGYQSLLERGQRRFERRGLLEDLAGALGCSVADLTGQPYLPPDRDTADAMAAIPGIRLALGTAAARTCWRTCSSSSRDGRSIRNDDHLG